MDRNEFISELRNRLKRLPQEEIDSAVNYYEEYFNEAGSANESATLAALGSPAIVAAKIIGEYAVSDTKNEKSKSKNTLWIVILAVCASPIALPLLFAVFMVIFALFITVFALVVSGVAVAGSGLIAIVIALWAFSFGWGTGLFYLGGGMCALALGVTMTILIYRLALVLIKALQKWLGKILIKRGTV